MAAHPNWTPLHAQVQRAVKKRQLIAANERVLVAVSGGQDSCCLLRVLLDLQPKWGWDLAVAHCDHRWQADIGNAAFVRQLAQTWQLPFYLQVAAAVDETEAGARAWRYQALGTIAQQHNFSCIVTGHTASDRAETLLYNLVRGSGADGLQALTWQRTLVPGVTLVRPLLELTRSETAQFCQDQQISVWNDPANQDLRYRRNRMRQKFIPYLQTYFNPQADRALAQTAELLQADVECLEAQASQLLIQVWDVEQQRLDRSKLQQLPLALQRRIIRQFLQTHLPTAPNFEQIEKLVALIDAPNCSQTDPLPGGTIAQVQSNWICLRGR